MKIELERILREIDTLFEGKKKNERIILLVMPIVTCAFLSYEFFWSASAMHVAPQRQTRDTLKKEIASTTEFLSHKNDHTEQINAIYRTNTQLATTLQNKKTLNAQLGNQISQIGFIYLNDANIVSFAQQNRVVLETMDTTVSDQKTGLFTKQLLIHITCSGTFQNTVAFINKLETADMLSSIKHISLKAGSHIHSDITLEVHGL